jgi:hypothetical protein
MSLIIGIIYLSLVPRYLNMNEDTGRYIRQSFNLWDTSRLPIGYPFLIYLARFTSDFYTAMTILQLFLFASIMHAIYLIRQKVYVLILVIISGAYLVYIPFIMSDLTFSFFVVWSYYALIKKHLAWHIVLIGCASLIRPTVAYFFVIEPFLVWLIFKDRKLAIYSFFLCYLATCFNPIKNLIDTGHYMQSVILKTQFDKYLLASSCPHYLYPFYSIASNSFSTHWFNLFRMFGEYKRNIEDGVILHGNLFVYKVHIIFLAWYFIFYSIFWMRSLRQKNWLALLWILYFTSTVIFCHALEADIG